MSNQPVSPTQPDPVEFLKNARDIAFLFAVFLYYMGWVYIYSYLNCFGLSIKAVDVDVYNLLIYSTNVFIYLYYNQKILVIAILIVFVLIRFSTKLSTIMAAFYPMIIVALFPLAFLYSKKAAEQSANVVLMQPAKALKGISFIFKEIKLESAKKKPIKADSVKDALGTYYNEEKINVLTQNKNGAFRLLVANKEEYYVLQVTENYNKDLPLIYVIKKDMIESALIVK